MRILRFLGIVFILQVSVITGFLVVEAFVRWNYPKRHVEKDTFIVDPIHHEMGAYEHIPTPYTMFTDTYRKPVTKAKARGEYRVFMIGGSTVREGNPPIAGLLEKKLQKKYGERVQVYNYGVTSQKSTQELVRILTEIVDHKPDFILMYNGGNDIMDPFYADPRPGYPYNYFVSEKNPLVQRVVKMRSGPADYPTLELTLFGSLALRHILKDYFLNEFFNQGSLRASVGFESEKWEQAIADTYIGNLEKAYKISKAFGAKFAGVFQPLAFFSPDAAKVPGLQEEAAEHARRVRPRIQDKIKKTSARILDFSSIYKNEKAATVFIDYIHTKQEHKNVVADKLFSVVAKEIKL